MLQGDEDLAHSDTFTKTFLADVYLFRTRISVLADKRTAPYYVTDTCQSIFDEIHEGVNAAKVKLIEMVLDRSVYVPVDIHPSAQDIIREYGHLLRAKLEPKFSARIYRMIAAITAKRDKPNADEASIKTAETMRDNLAGNTSLMDNLLFTSDLFKSISEKNESAKWLADIRKVC